MGWAAGRFITFEGTEGSGKTTQIRLLASALEHDGHHVVSTREPGGTELGESLRRLLLDGDVPIRAETEAYLMTAARAEHVRSVIRPALADGCIVLCDRFVDSTLAYQGGGRGLDVDQLRSLQTMAVDGVWPDLTVLVDVPIEVGLERRRGEEYSNRIDRETAAFHKRVAAWYRSEALTETARWVIVDGAAAPEIVHTQIIEHVQMRLAADSVVRLGG